MRQGRHLGIGDDDQRPGLFWGIAGNEVRLQGHALEDDRRRPDTTGWGRGLQFALLGTSLPAKERQGAHLKPLSVKTSSDAFAQS